MVPVQLQGLEWVRAESAVQCIRRDSIPQAQLVRVQECRGVRDLVLRVQELAQPLAWRRRLVLQIGHREVMRSGVAETIVTKSRRKVQ
jgi:hypothetical protein